MRTEKDIRAEITAQQEQLDRLQQELREAQKSSEFSNAITKVLGRHASSFDPPVNRTGGQYIGPEDRAAHYKSMTAFDLIISLYRANLVVSVPLDPFEFVKDQTAGLGPYGPYRKYNMLGSPVISTNEYPTVDQLNGGIIYNIKEKSH